MINEAIFSLFRIKPYKSYEGQSLNCELYPAILIRCWKFFGESADFGYHKRLLAKAFAEWDLRYFSKLAAFWGQLKAIAVLILQGRCVEI